KGHRRSCENNQRVPGSTPKAAGGRPSSADECQPTSKRIDENKSWCRARVLNLSASAMATRRNNAERSGPESKNLSPMPSSPSRRCANWVSSAELNRGPEKNTRRLVWRRSIEESQDVAHS